MKVRIPKKVRDRFTKQIPAFQRVLQSARDRDVNESDTVTIITDMLAGIFGYDKYAEVTREHAIRRTFCDLAIELDGDVKFLMEVKAIGLTLKENHLRQAVNYGANRGIQWVVLTNGVVWEVYRIRFERPVAYDLTCSFDFLELNARRQQDQELLFVLCREGLAKAAIQAFHEHVEVVNRFMLGAIIKTDPVLDVMRRELRRLAPEAKVSREELSDLLSDVLKRDVIEGEDAVRAQRRVSRASGKTLRKKRNRRKTGALPETSARQELEQDQAAE